MSNTNSYAQEDPIFLWYSIARSYRLQKRLVLEGSKLEINLEYLVFTMKSVRVCNVLKSLLSAKLVPSRASSVAFLYLAESSRQLMKLPGRGVGKSLLQD